MEAGELWVNFKGTFNYIYLGFSFNPINPYHFINNL
jgi:hypothetical protein